MGKVLKKSRESDPDKRKWIFQCPSICFRFLEYFAANFDDSHKFQNFLTNPLHDWKAKKQNQIL